MKYTAFLFALLMVVPIASAMAAYSLRIREFVFAALVFSTAFIDTIDINFMDRMWYSAPVRGFQFSFVDFFALILLFSTLLSARRERFRLFWPASLGLMLVYFVYCCLSVATSDPKLFGLFELSKILRGLVVFLAVAWHIRSERDVYILLTAVGAVLVYEGLLALLQRYVWGVFRVSGTFPHPNVLADYCGMLAPLCLAVAFSNARLLVRLFFAAAWALAGVAVILSISRMGTLAFVFGSLGVLLVALRTQLQLWKVASILMISVIGVGILYKGWDKLEARQQNEKSWNYGDPDGQRGRSGFYKRAGTMASRYPLGVGLNNWSWWVSANSEEFDLPFGRYASTDEPGDARHEVFAHSLYAMTLGELGWPGLFILTALWCQWFLMMGRFLFVRGSDILTLAGIGCFFAFTSVIANNITECSFRTQYQFIVFSVLLGSAVAIRHKQTMNYVQRRHITP